MLEVVDYSKYAPETLLEMGVRTERQERLSISSVVREDALIDQQHAENLAESMMGDRKQISPTTLRARMDNGKVVYDVIDGFHRSEGKRIIETRTNVPQYLDAIVLYGCADEELFDLRVLAASSVKSIKFARMAEWMKQSFMSTTWKNQRLHKLVRHESITLSQVFNLAQFDSSGKRLDLQAEEVNELKEWALKKSKQWGRPLSTLMVEMRTVELASPELVQRVRTGGGGKDRKGVLTRARLDKIVTNLPGDWETQVQFANLAVEKNILADDLDFLTFCYVQAREAADSDSMKKILNQPELFLSPVAGVLEEDRRVDQSHVLFEASVTKVEKYGKSYTGKRSTVFKEKREKGEDVREKQLLIKHNIPEVISALERMILNGRTEFEILNLPKEGPIILNIESRVMNLFENIVKLTDEEAKAMVIFSLLEGVQISDTLLSALVESIGRNNIKNIILSLKGKIKSLSESAAEELWIGRKGQYSWLEE